MNKGVGPLGLPIRQKISWEEVSPIYPNCQCCTEYSDLKITFQVSKHRTSQDCWVVLNGEVYDITTYLDFHPGGKYIG